MSISDERGLNLDRNAAILLKSRFLNLMNMKTHFWLLLVFCLQIHRSRLFSLLSVALPYNILRRPLSLFVRFSGFFLLFFYYSSLKTNIKTPMHFSLVLKTMTLKSQTSIGTNIKVFNTWPV